VQSAQTANAKFRLNRKRRKFAAGWQLLDLESFCTNTNEMRGRLALGGICALRRVASLEVEQGCNIPSSSSIRLLQ
jgi:hypothetical protein